ncbi:MAG: glycosyltransferase [Candidatus Odinarchaeia archaeon]
MTLISFIIPIHNEGALISYCLKSILKLNIPANLSLELILVFDRCEDKSREIARSILRKYNSRNFRVLEVEKNWLKSGYGYPEAVNYGYKFTKGDFLAIIDADTYLTRNWIKYIMLNFENSNVGSVSGNLITLGRNFISQCVKWRETFLGTNRVYRRKIWDLIGGFKFFESCDTVMDLEILRLNYVIIKEFKAISYDLREYTIGRLWSQGYRRGIGRYEIGQTLPYLIGHGFKSVLNSPLGIIELFSVIYGWFEGFIKNKRRIDENLIKIEKIWEKTIIKKDKDNSEKIVLDLRRLKE